MSVQRFARKMLQTFSFFKSATAVFDQDSHDTAADHSFGFGNFSAHIDAYQTIGSGSDHANRCLNDRALGAAASDGSGDLAQRY